MQGKPIVNIIRDDISFPLPKFKITTFPSFNRNGRFLFEVDLNPGATVSYQVVGLKISEIMDKEERDNDESETPKRTKK